MDIVIVSFHLLCSFILPSKLKTIVETRSQVDELIYAYINLCSCCSFLTLQTAGEQQQDSRMEPVPSLCFLPHYF